MKNYVVPVTSVFLFLGMVFSRPSLAADNPGGLEKEMQQKLERATNILSGLVDPGFREDSRKC